MLARTSHLLAGSMLVLSLAGPAHASLGVDDSADASAALSCSVSSRLKLARLATQTSIMTTTFAVLGALFLFRRRRP
jgi:hypothetical protein